MNSIPWLVDDKLKKKVVSKQQKKYIQDTLKTNKNQLYLDTNMDAGHGGASGRFEAIKEIAKEYSFLLDLEGIKK